jgi:uncharacterized protein (DUF2164 family)
MSIELSKERRRELIRSIKGYFLEQHDQEIGDLKAGLLLDFFLGLTGPSIYNQAIKDAQAYFQQKVEDLDGVCFRMEKDRPRNEGGTTS